MEFKENREGEYMIIEIEGRLDTTNNNLLEKKLMALIEVGETKIIVDCSKMDYISSSGLRVFLLALKKMTLVKGRFILADLQETTLEIFEIAGFTTIFEICKTREEAIGLMGLEVRK